MRLLRAALVVWALLGDPVAPVASAEPPQAVDAERVVLQSEDYLRNPMLGPQNDPARAVGFGREVFILVFLFGSLVLGIISLWGAEPDK